MLHLVTFQEVGITGVSGTDVPELVMVEHKQGLDPVQFHGHAQERVQSPVAAILNVVKV